ncbi:ABC transporter permease [Schaalia sp. 19OD2882]|uniref:ABC transporter permease n=1 Tax=Schaalia sp. 19OD2882 TaxID=2794089 RepID=UPI001C1E9841|nr:ABC transporter permease [Schaalia sp. 19OD2882]QWW20057.1 ABC transporter permease [Schaalia sp. 19OD2882]
MSTPSTSTDTGAAPTRGRHAAEGPSWVTMLLRRFFNPSTSTIAGAILVALVIGALVVAFFDPRVQETAGYFFARPSDFLAAFWNSFSGFFISLVRGALYDWTQPDFMTAIRPLTDTMTRSVPLIIAGLAIAVSFTAGMFNIGVQGQLMMGAALGGFIGFHYHLPPVAHMILAILGALIGGALWGFIPGILRAKLQANEVIVTIMLNSVASLFLGWLLNLQLFYGEGGYPSKSQRTLATAQYPQILGPNFRLHLGFIIALLAAVFVWWLLKRSTLGFELRAAGANPQAARTAGINVPRTLMMTLVISGALAGLAATAPVLGTEKVVTNSVAGSYGFDAITVALLGKSTPFGVVLAGLLFGGLAAAGSVMQASKAQIPVDIVQITQAVIVLLIAASEAIRMRREKLAADAASNARTAKAAASKEGEQA